MSDNKRCLLTDFELFFKKWNRKVYYYAYGKTNSIYIAEETVQRTFIKLWRNQSNSQINVSLESQLFCIARSTLLDIIKEENNRQKLCLPTMQESHCTTPFEEYYSKQLEENIHQVINKMPKIRKEVFTLSRFEYLSHKEISERLHISPKTVENHISLALKTLRKMFFELLFLFSYLF